MSQVRLWLYCGGGDHCTPHRPQLTISLTQPQARCLCPAADRPHPFICAILARALHASVTHTPPSHNPHCTTNTYLRHKHASATIHAHTPTPPLSHFSPTRSHSQRRRTLHAPPRCRPPCQRHTSARCTRSACRWPSARRCHSAAWCAWRRRQRKSRWQPSGPWRTSRWVCE